MSETDTLPEKKKDGWRISFVLRWALLFCVDHPEAHNLIPLASYTHGIHGVHVAVKWFAAHPFRFQIPTGQFWNVAVGVLGAIPLAFIWTIFDRRSRSNVVLREIVYLMVRYSLAAGMMSYGTIKLIEQQGTHQPAPIDWIRPLGEISTGQVMWTWLGYSPTFEFFAGLNELLGAILLLFRRTTFLAALLIFPVMVYVTAMDITFHVGPAAGAALFASAALYLVAREWRRWAAAFLFQKSAAPASSRKLWTSPRMVLAGRGLWTLVVAYSLWIYVIPHFRTKADIGGRQSPLSGAYQVERFVSDGRVLPEEGADPTRWREVAIGWFGDYIRIRRMDDSELLWSVDPGDPYPFMPATGHAYHYGDYGRLLAKTAGVQEQLRFKELPNYGSPHTAALLPLGPILDDPVLMSHYTRGQFFTVNFVRDGSDRVLLQGLIDGAEISVDLVRINNDDFEFFKTREGLP